ncbi:MAG: FAD-containing oxidoreductase [Anaerolineae bacterium]|nr:FAD-containing oxidoreductase [Anaerolineae bacterium]
MMMKYDAIIIGAGQGGGPLAHKLADLKWKVALIEQEHLGGSCINYGCTPTKTMLASARLAHYARRAPEFGVHTGPVQVNLAEVVGRKNKLVLAWRQGQEGHAANRPTLDLYRGHGRFTGAHTVEVNGQVLTSDYIFINTGTRSRIPDIPGLDQTPYLTNRNIMDLTEAPEHMLVLGGNYLGLEFGQMFRRFGSQVTVVELMDQLVPREDEDVAEALQQALEVEGMRFHLGATASRVTKTARGLELTITYRQDDRTETLTGSHLLVSIGQVPNTDTLGLEAARIETDKGGWIKVNHKLETNVPGVWAIGDVKGGPAFTHIAYDDHLVIYDNLINGKNRSIAGRLVPYALFTDPELGRVGLTEKEAQAAGYKLKVGKISMSWVARAIERDETAGLMKIVVNAANDRILGAAILGSEGGELVQILMALMMADAPYTLFEKSIYIHPTLAEGFFTLMDNVKPI